MNRAPLRVDPRLLTGALLLVVLQSVEAEIPQVISYQGHVTDSGGTPVADGTYTMRFRIYDAATGGTLDWDSGNRSITVSDGVFNVLLGESPQPTLDLPFDEDYWLLVTFDGAAQTPRQRLGSVGCAYMASGLVPGTLIEGSVSSATYSAIKGVNTATSGSRYGGRFESNSSAGSGVYGYATTTTGTTYGGYFKSSSTSGSGAYGYVSATTGTTYGVYGVSASTAGRGLNGWASATTGISYGVYGLSSSNSGRGVYGQAPLYGVYGKATATTGVNYGGYFETASEQGSAVRGIATATSGVTFGIYGRSYSIGDGSRGIYGRSYATEGETYGVCGQSDSEDGIGVLGIAGTTSVVY